MAVNNLHKSTLLIEKYPFETQLSILCLMFQGISCYTKENKQAGDWANVGTSLPLCMPANGIAVFWAIKINKDKWSNRFAQLKS